MSTLVDARLESFRGQARVRAGSLITTVLGDAVLPRGGRIWLGSLIALLEPLGLSERLIRTSVFRLAKDEWLYAEALGRRADYVLTADGRQRFAEASRQIYALHSPQWDRRWRLILAVGELTPKTREALRRALFWQGFGSIGADCFVHPSADLDTVFSALKAEGLGESRRQLVPVLSTGIPASDAEAAVALVRRAWNLGELGCAYSGFVQQYQPLRAALAKSSIRDVTDESSFLTRVLLIHDFRRLLLRDPELPDELLPTDWPGHRARALCADLYRRLLDASERHLDRRMQLADGRIPTADPILRTRFSDDK